MLVSIGRIGRVSGPTSTDVSLDRGHPEQGNPGWRSRAGLLQAAGGSYYQESGGRLHRGASPAFYDLPS